MGLSKEGIDKVKNRCYPKIGEEISVFIVEPEEGVTTERLSMALNLILSDEDVIHYLTSPQNETKGKAL